MDEHKIAFITCVSDERMYARSIAAINQLTIPPGYSIEILPIYSAASMTSGYNTAMYRSNAKYKVYLHQDTFLIYSQVIAEFLSLFNQHPQIGMIGVMGTKSIPTSGTWWEGERLYTKFVSLIQGESSLQVINEIPSGYETVQGIDGALMITQVDLPWDEAITGFHFYDASQSIRFNRHGLQVIVPAQSSPWIQHYREHETNQAEYEACRLRFLMYYAQDLASS